MSGPTKCEYCRLQAIRDRAQKKGYRLEIKMEHGCQVYVYVNGKINAWFAILPDHCCCKEG
jgi:hypothetical protein